jgi:hypothetical protein
MLNLVVRKLTASLQKVKQAMGHDSQQFQLIICFLGTSNTAQFYLFYTSEFWKNISASYFLP